MSKKFDSALSDVVLTYAKGLPYERFEELMFSLKNIVTQEINTQLAAMALREREQYAGRRTHTHTFACLDVTEATYSEVKAKLEAAGYDHVFIANDDAPALPVINMHGLALRHEVEMIGDAEPQQY